MTEQASRGPQHTWTLPFLGEPSVGLTVTLRYGDPYGTRRWGAVWYGSGTSHCRTPWGALWRARRHNRLRRAAALAYGNRRPCPSVFPPSADAPHEGSGWSGQVHCVYSTYPAHREHINSGIRWTS